MQDRRARFTRWIEELGGNIVRSDEGAVEEVELVESTLNARQLAPLAELAALSVLGMARCSLTGAAVLRAIARVPTLVELRLNGTRGGKIGLAALAALPRLASLDLAVSDVTDRHLADVARFPALTDLDLAHTAVTDRGLRFLRKLPALRHLDLCKTRVTPEGCLAFWRERPEVHLASLPDETNRRINEERERAAMALRPKPLPDPAPWVSRLVAYVRHAARVVPNKHTRAKAARPLSASRLAALERRLPRDLPVPLRRLLIEGSAGVEFRIELPARYVGGGTLAPACDLAAYQRMCERWARESWIAGFADEQQRWLRSVAFLALANGDYLALDPGLDPREPPVVHLAHDGRSRVIARSLGAFLQAWERLGYVGPDIDDLTEHLDPRTGCLSYRKP